MLQGLKVGSCGSEDTLWSAVRLELGKTVTMDPDRPLGNWERGLSVGTTHIVIVAGTAKHDDASAAKLQDEKGQWIERRCHGWERGEICVFLTTSGYLYIPVASILIQSPSY